MNYVNYLLALCLLGLVGCQADQQTPEQFTESLPQVHPQKMSQFQKVDSLYFGYLGNQTIAMDDGSVVIPLQREKRLLQVSPNGDIIKEIAGSGRGPGEVLDLLFIQRTQADGVLVVDQKNNKIIRFGPDLELVTEMRPQPPEESILTGVYPMQEEQKFIFRSASTRYLRDKEASPSLRLSSYHPNQEYQETMQVRDHRMALTFSNGRLVGASEVPDAPSQQVAYHPATQSLYSYWTGSNAIAKLSSNLDTLQTIPVDLPAQPLRDAKYDSIEAETRDREWNTLKNELPNMKTPVERMLIDEQGRFWLRLNYRGDTQQWLVMSDAGEYQKIVHLPRGSMLTHISDHHLGVRLDERTFALFKPVDS
jgi:hypothetical protein